MVAPAYFTWDYDTGTGRVATAASLDDLGSAALVDEEGDPPIPPEMPYAAQMNQWAKQLGGVNRVIESAIVEVHFAAGVPSIFAATAMSTIITTTWAQTNIIVTDNGVGDVTLTWPVGSIPSPRAQPWAHIIEDGVFFQPIALPLASGVRVKLYDAASAAVDKNFSVHIL